MKHGFCKTVLFAPLLAVTAVGLSGCGDGTGPSGARLFTSLTAITADGGRFVAVGTSNWGTDAVVPNSDSIVIMSSPDGEEWEVAEIKLPGGLRSVAFGNGRYVAVGTRHVSAVGPDSSFPIVLTSTDGIAWSVSDGVPSLRWSSVTFGNGTFVGTGPDSSLVETIATSVDGLTWSEKAVADILSVEVTFGGGQFVLWGESNGIGVSSDGRDWDVVSLDSLNRVVDVAFLDGRLVGSGMFDCCFGEVPDAIKYFGITSTDGETWTIKTRDDPATIFFAHAFGSGRLVAIHSEEIFSSADGETWTREIELNDHINDVTFGSGRFVAVGQVIASSTNGTDWSISRLPE